MTRAHRKSMSKKLNPKNFTQFFKSSGKHPEFEPYYMFNDTPNSKSTVYLKSYLSTEPVFKKLKIFDPFYYFKVEREDIDVIEIPIGGYARLPHSCYTISTRDGSPASVGSRLLKDL